MLTSAELTARVIAPTDAVVGPDRLEAVRHRLADGLASSAAADRSPVSDGRGPLVVTLPLLRRLRAGRGDPPRREPFAWKPSFLERTLGAAAVDACVRGGYRAPAEAAGPVLEGALAAWRRTGERTFHWEPWVAGLGPGGRAAVLAGAVSWATSLWSAFDWAGFAEPPRIGGPSGRWSCRGAPGIRLTSRTDLRVRLGRTNHAEGGPANLALVSVLRGAPSPGSEAELAYPALVAALCTPSAPVPVRSVGLWPDAGLAESVEVDEQALEAAVDLVLEVVGRLSAPDTGEPEQRRSCEPKEPAVAIS